MKDLIRNMLREARKPVHGTSLPDGYKADRNTRKTFEAGGIKYRVIYPWNHERNGNIMMQVVPYDDKDIAVYEEIKDLGPYGDESYYRDGSIYEWVKESGDRIFSALNSYINNDHDWRVRKVEEDHGYIIYIRMNIFDLVEDYLNIADEGNPFDKIK